MSGRKSNRARREREARTTSQQVHTLTDKETEPDWSSECEVCGSRPIVPITGMCGPCTFGEAETIGGNW